MAKKTPLKPIQSFQNKSQNKSLQNKSQNKTLLHVKEKGYDRNTYKQSCGQILTTIMDTARREENKAYTIPEYPFIEKWKLKSFFSPSLRCKISDDQVHDEPQPQKPKRRNSKKQVSQPLKQKEIITNSIQKNFETTLNTQNFPKKIFYTSVYQVPLQCSFCDQCNVQQVCFIEFMNQFVARCPDHSI